MPNVEQIIFALIIIAVALIFSNIAMLILRKAKFLTQKTETTLDDTIISLLARPVHLGFLLAGILIAVNFLFPNLSFKEYVFNDFVYILATIWVAYFVNRLARGIIGWYEGEAEGGDQKNVFGFLETIVSIVIFSIAILVVLKSLGVDVSTLFAGLGIAGLAIAFALQNTLSGIFSAFSIAVDKPIRQGDFVKLDDGTEGFVEDISTRATRIRTFSNNLVIVPNAKLAEMIITNYYMPEQEVGVVVPCGVSYDSDLEKVEKITIKVADQILKKYGGVEGFEPYLRFNTFGDSAISFNVILRVNNFMDQYIVKHEFIKALHSAYKKEKVEIPYPQMDVHLDK